MLGAIAKRLFGSANDRLIKSLRNDIAAISALEPEMKKLSDDELRGKTNAFRERLANGETVDGLLNEAFAVVREGSIRSLGMRHFDVQLMGGLVLHRGSIAEMKTGEGKTLVATLAAYTNALSGEGVHVVTVNDYLARRDAAWMGTLYEFLGLRVGVVVPGMDDEARKEAYACDITYATNNELGFDYLRDNMKLSLEGLVQRGHHFAIVDEVDSILVDEARTPLIISGPAEDSSELYIAINKIIPSLEPEDYEKDEKQRTVVLTEKGTERIQDLLVEADLLKSGDLYDPENVTLVHHVQEGLKAHQMFQRDVHYLVRNNKVVIVDEFTGRMMEGRRFSGGLHQALEAKEKVSIQPENQTLASITFQNYFRLYGKLSGMTGTAATEAAEFAEIYGLEVAEIPTNVSMIREDEHDEIYRTAREKNEALIQEIEEANKKNQPVLVGTVSIERSEQLSAMLKKKKLPHQVLNARYHEQEATIIAQAGRPGAITIATNMAGRGTDIKLGGNADMRIEHELGDNPDEGRKAAIIEDVNQEMQKVLEAGGLYVIGTERHESRRIDNQLRGRSGRQGDPGRSKFFLSLEDDLMRIFGSERMDGMLQKLGLQEGEAIVHPWINKALQKAQSKVEARNFDIRKNLLKYDDVMNDQRKVIFEQRRELMDAEDLSETLKDMRDEVIDRLINQYIPEKSYAEQWDSQGLKEDCNKLLALDLPIEEWFAEEGIAEEEIRERITDAADRKTAAKIATYGDKIIKMAEKNLLLQLLDHLWKEHLLQLDHLRQGIHLRGYGQRDPLNEYKREAFGLFEAMLHKLRETITSMMAHLDIRMQMPESEAVSRRQPAMAGAVAADALAADDGRPNAGDFSNVPRNAPCPCGSGKKFKQCHGKIG